MIGCKQARIGLVLFSVWAAWNPAWAVSYNRINDVRLTEQDRGIVVEIASEKAPNFTTFKQDTPKRVIVDVAECDLNGVPKQIKGDGSLVGSITTRQYGKSPHGISRVVIKLLREAEYRVTIRGGSLFVHLSPGTGGLLVSAGVPIGPDRKLTRKSEAIVASAKPAQVEPRDEALSEELSKPEVEEVEEEAGPAVVAEPIDEPSYVKISDPQPEPDSESATSPPEPVDASAKPVRVAVATVPEKEPAPAVAAAPPPPEPIEVAQAAEVEESEAAPVEVVEEVEEVPEEAVPEVPLPPPGADAAGKAEEDAAPPPVEEAVPLPPPPADEVPPPPEEAVPPPPPEEAAPPPPPPDTYTAEAEERVEISSAVKHMTWVGFQQTRNASRVFIKTNEPVEYRLSEEGDNLVVLELENTTIPLRNNKRFLDTHFFDSAVTMITPREIHGVGRNVRVEIQIKKRVPYRVAREDNIVYVNFERPQ